MLYTSVNIAHLLLKCCGNYVNIFHVNYCFHIQIEMFLIIQRNVLVSVFPLEISMAHCLQTHKYILEYFLLHCSKCIPYCNELLVRAFSSIDILIKLVVY